MEKLTFGGVKWNPDQAIQPGDIYVAKGIKDGKVHILDAQTLATKKILTIEEWEALDCASTPKEGK